MALLCRKRSFLLNTFSSQTKFDAPQFSQRSCFYGPLLSALREAPPSPNRHFSGRRRMREVTACCHLLPEYRDPDSVRRPIIGGRKKVFFCGVFLISGMDFCAHKKAGGRVEASFARSPRLSLHSLRAVDIDSFVSSWTKTSPQRQMAPKLKEHRIFRVFAYLLQKFKKCVGFPVPSDVQKYTPFKN